MRMRFLKRQRLTMTASGSSCSITHLPSVFRSSRRAGTYVPASGTIRAAPELDDRHFIYFTDVPRFENATDLMSVAMTDGGFTIGMQYDDPKLPPEIIVVPARDRAQMSERIDCLVEPWLIESSPMLFHDPSLRGEGFARYWEFSHPNIYRIPVKPEPSVSFPSPVS